MKTHKKREQFELCNDEALTRSVGEWEGWLKKLRYEGRAWFEGNLSSVRARFMDFQDKLRSHFQVEESIIFPFFRRHIPRTDAPVDLFSSEHREIMVLMRTVMEIIRTVELSPALLCPGQETVRLSEMGVYLTSYVRHHLAVENAILKKAWGELRSCEKEALRNLVEAKVAKGKAGGVSWKR